MICREVPSVMWHVLSGPAGRDGGAAVQFVQGETDNVADCNVHMDNAAIAQNSASGRGGGLVLAIYGFGGVTASGISLEHARACNNSAGAGDGGGVFALVSGSALLNSGIAVEIRGARVQLENVSATDNTAGRMMFPAATHTYFVGSHLPDARVVLVWCARAALLCKCCLFLDVMQVGPAGA